LAMLTHVSLVSCARSLKLRVVNLLNLFLSFIIAVSLTAVLLLLQTLQDISSSVIVYTYNFSSDGSPTPATLEVPHSMMEQLAGKTITIEYRDVYGHVVQASDMWLIWVP
jgi:hypothetical protein